MNSLATEAIGHRLVVAVGDDLPGVAVKHDGRDVRAGLGGIGGGPPGPGVQAVEGRRGLVGRGFRQRGPGALRGDDGQLRSRGLRGRAVHLGFATGDERGPQ